MRAKGISFLFRFKTFEFIFDMELNSPILNIIFKVSCLFQSPKTDIFCSTICILSCIHGSLMLTRAKNVFES